MNKLEYTAKLYGKIFITVDPILYRKGELRNLIKIDNLNLNLGVREIFSGLNFEVRPGEKIGLIGGEGSGKSTLLDIISGRLPVTSGRVEVSGEVQTVNGNVYADFSELRMVEMSAIEKLKRALRGLRDSEVILLLDEPTNNLDEVGIEWLIKFLRSRKDLTAVVAGNDRYFLKRTCNRIVQLGKMESEPITLDGANDFEIYKPDDFAAPKVLEVADLIKIRDGDPIFKHIGFTLRQGQKVAFVGKNELGKSKLLKTLALASEGDPGRDVKGTIEFHEGAKIAYMPRVYSGTSARTEIEKLQNSHANFLILDNPTSCLDLPKIKALEYALAKFPGTVVFADEDRVFIDTVATRIINVTPDGTVDRICGYEEFLANETVKAQIEEKYNFTE